MTIDLKLRLFEIIQIFFFLISAVGVALALISYRTQIRLKRAEWLKTLFEKFFENPTFKDIRRKMDYNMAALQNNLHKDQELEENLVDYLNFFELIASLWKLKQISLHEIRMLFEYYVNLIQKSSFLRTYLEKQGFENLHRLIKKLEKK